MSRPSTSPFSVNEQFQESFLWDKGGKRPTLATSQKSKRKNIFIFSGDNLALLLKPNQMHVKVISSLQYNSLNLEVKTL